jgi:hypothetical protein
MEESRPQTHHLTPLAPTFLRTRILGVCVKRVKRGMRAAADKPAPQHRRHSANARRGRELNAAAAAAAARIPHLTRTSSLPQARWSPLKCSLLFFWFLRAHFDTHMCASDTLHYGRHMRMRRRIHAYEEEEDTRCTMKGTCTSCMHRLADPTGIRTHVLVSSLSCVISYHHKPMPSHIYERHKH